MAPTTAGLSSKKHSKTYEKYDSETTTRKSWILVIDIHAIDMNYMRYESYHTSEKKRVYTHSESF